MLDADDGLPEPIVKVAWLFAPEDDALQRELEIHLSPLKQSGQIRTWNERDIVAGTPLQEIEHSLRSADLVVPLVSAYFIDQFHERIRQVWSWYQKGQVRIVPIIAGPCSYDHTPFGKLVALPSGGKGLTQWRNRQAACANVEQGMRRVIERVLAQKLEETGITYYDMQRYEQALQAFAQALRHDEQNFSVYKHKGDALCGMMNYKEAIVAYEHAIKLQPGSGPAWAGLYKALKARGKQIQEYYDQRAEEAEKQANELEHENRRRQDER